MSNRVRLVAVSRNVLEGMLRGDLHAGPVDTNLPEGFRVLDAFTSLSHSATEGVFYFKIEHESFEPVEDGQHIPHFVAEFTLRPEVVE